MRNAIGVGILVAGVVLVLSAVRNQNPAHVVAAALGFREDPPDPIQP